MAFSEEVKRLAKQRAHYTCVVCRQVRGFLEVHHIIPKPRVDPTLSTIRRHFARPVMATSVTIPSYVSS